MARIAIYQHHESSVDAIAIPSLKSHKHVRLKVWMLVGRKYMEGKKMIHRSSIRKYVLWFLVGIIMYTIGNAQSIEERTLTLVTGEYLEYANSVQMVNAIASLQALVPETVIEIRNFSGDYWKEQMITALMANEDGMDVLPMTNDMFEVYTQHNLLTNLSDAPGFQSNISSWLDITDLLSNKGALLCVPVEIVPVYYFWNEKLGKQYEIEKPSESWSWGDMTDMMDSILSKASSTQVQLFAERSLYIPTMFWQYTSSSWQEFIDDEKSYDTQEFRDLLATCKDLWERKLIQDFDFGVLPEPSTVLVIAGAYISRDTYTAGENWSLVTLPRLQNERFMPVGMYTLGANSQSSNRDLSAQLLQIYSSKENIEKSGQQPGLILNDTSYWKSLSESDRYISDAEASAFRKYVAYGSRDIDDEAITKTAWEIFPKYIAGDLTVDDVIRRMNHALNLATSG